MRAAARDSAVAGVAERARVTSRQAESSAAAAPRGPRGMRRSASMSSAARSALGRTVPEVPERVGARSAVGRAERNQRELEVRQQLVPELPERVRAFACVWNASRLFRNRALRTVRCARGRPISGFLPLLCRRGHTAGRDGATLETRARRSACRPNSRTCTAPRRADGPREPRRVECSDSERCAASPNDGLSVRGSERSAA
jgi:hypothetical protein